MVRNALVRTWESTDKFSTTVLAYLFRPLWRANPPHSLCYDRQKSRRIRRKPSATGFFYFIAFFPPMVMKRKKIERTQEARRLMKPPVQPR